MFYGALTRTHICVFLTMLLAFTVLTFLVTHAGVDKGPDHAARIAQATLGTITGPMTGAVSRGFQGCCTRFSLAVMAYCGPVLLLGVLAQFIRLPKTKSVAAVRMSLWVMGWLVWFLGGLLSFGHALS